MSDRLVDTIGQFTTIPNSIVRMIPDIGEHAFMLFFYLRYRSNEQGQAFPSYTLIQTETTLTRQQISDAINTLVTAGLLECKRRFSSSTVYTLKMPDIARPAEPQPQPAPAKKARKKPAISINGGLMESAPLVSQVDCISRPVILPLVEQVDANQTHINKTQNNKTQIEQPPAIEKDFPASKEPNWKNLTIFQVKRLPEIAVFLEATGKDYPGDVYVSAIWKCIHDHSFKADYLRPFWEEWRDRGYNLKSIKWLTEWAVNGVIPAQHTLFGPQNQRTSSLDRSLAAVAQFIQEQS